MSFILAFIFLTILATLSGNADAGKSLSRSSFPQGFLFGAGSSSYQIEGNVNEDGKVQGSWDYNIHKYPNRIEDGSSGDVADDFYHHYKEDIKVMKEMGLDSFRLSISWPRILPKGNKAGGVNQLGIDFYNNVINELVANGIQPFVSLCHFDTPQALEEKYGGFLSPNMVLDFVEYANICFKEFGDRVKHWVTINEPNVYARFGYSNGLLVPNRCTRTNGSSQCIAGNSATEPYLVGHHLLLSHASAVDLYKRKYQASQNGEIGISTSCDWIMPYDEQPHNKDAAERYYQQNYGWFLNPVTYGEYPKSMRSLVGERLPRFTKKQSEMLKKSYDFIAINYYTALYAYEQPPTMQHFEQDAHAAITYWNRDNESAGKPTPMFWLFDYPKGLEKLVLNLKERYGNPAIVIAENGYGTKDKLNATHSVEEYLQDTPRIEYVQGHLNHLLQAIKRGANVKGYFVWSFLDVFEWNSGYLDKYGLVYIDRQHNLTRVMKNSGKWYKNFLRGQMAYKQPTSLKASY